VRGLERQVARRGLRSRSVAKNVVFASCTGLAFDPFVRYGSVKNLVSQVPQKIGFAQQAGAKLALEFV
jgi:hypothetical protein